MTENVDIVGQNQGTLHETIYGPIVEYTDIPQPQDDPLTSTTAHRTHYESFGISQRDTIFQRYIYDYVHAARPFWHMPDELASEVLTQNIKTVKQTVHPQNHMATHRYVDQTEYEIEEEVKGELETFQRSLNGIDMLGNKELETLDKQRLVPILAQSLIEQDHKYRMGRKRESMDMPHPYNPRRDPFFPIQHFMYLVETRMEKEIPWE